LRDPRVELADALARGARSLRASPMLAAVVGGGALERQHAGAVDEALLRQPCR
jgi:hypothetical protein